MTTTAEKLSGRVVVVTGAAQGQGLAETRLLASEGASVWATDLTDTTPDLLQDVPGVAYRRLDVTDRAGWEGLADELLAEHGHVDGLVLNAGVTWRARLADLDPADLARLQDVNVTGALHGLQALTPLMTGGGSVVLVGSVAALTAHAATAYTVSKWGLRGLARVACLELGPRGIRVNTVHPGYIETPMTASASSAFRDANLAETPLGRTGSVDDVAPLVLFLLGDGSRFITGAEIPVDGGLTAHGGVKSIADALAAVEVRA